MAEQARILFEDELTELKENNRFRTLNLPQGLDLTSNDYLGMAGDPFLRQVAIDALQNGLDIGGAGSRLLRGHTQSHKALEDYAAMYFNAPQSLFFSSGFQANYALLTTLPKRGDIILYDSLIHASMRDGIRASDSKGYKFTHNDINHLEVLLKKHDAPSKTLWVCVEALYSMDGDFAPLNDIVKIIQKHNTILIVDEAHSSGIYGPKGRGLSQSIIQKTGHDRLITVHTCGKAIGVAGGLVCASESIIQALINKARPFIYSTAPMPLQAYLVQKSLEFLDTDEGENRRAQLLDLCKHAQSLFGGAGSQIVPIILGDDHKALSVAAKLQAQGYDIRAIRPPTVAEGTARLRLSLSSSLKKEQLENFYSELRTII
ncbi:MAG: 8-amino-7-oxononanoate synthase [Alphaproteobacteria bacterium]|nr:8-amino-7-oxononanoate synthase [Alphaproteobacteria bacterium]